MPDYDNYSISHNSNGSITLNYTPSKPGSYRILVECDGRLCSGFPLCCLVQKIDNDFITSYEVEKISDNEQDIPQTEETPVELPVQDVHPLVPVAENVEQQSIEFMPVEQRPDEILASQEAESSSLSTNVQGQQLSNRRPIPDKIIPLYHQNSQPVTEHRSGSKVASEVVDFSKTEWHPNNYSGSPLINTIENEMVAEPATKRIKIELEEATPITGSEPVEKQPGVKDITLKLDRPEAEIEGSLIEQPESEKHIPQNSVTEMAVMLTPDDEPIQSPRRSPTVRRSARHQKTPPKGEPITAPDAVIEAKLHDESDAQKVSRLCASLKTCRSPAKDEGKPTFYRIFCCEQDFYGLEEMEKHIEEAHRGADIVPTQREAFKRIRERQASEDEKRKSHITMGEEVTLEDLLEKVEGRSCPLCEKKFSTKQTVQSHIKRIHYQVPSGLKPEKCGVCGKVYRNKYTLQLHVARMHTERGKYPCSEEECPKRFNSKRDLQLHMRVHRGLPTVYKSKEAEVCQLCGKSFSAGNLKAHIERKHKAQADAFTCKDCGKTFKLQDDLVRHSIVHDTHRQAYSCETCGKMFLKKVSLQHHIKAAHESKDQIPCTAKDCNKVFPTEQKLKAHYHAVHRPRDAIHCSFEGCSSVFRDKRALRKHEMTHEGYRWMCTEDGCNKMFTQKHSLLRHINDNHRGEVPATIPCTHPNCNKMFKYKDMLKVHLRSHLMTRDFHCNSCKKSFKTQSLLTTHSKIHDKDRHYKCRYCQESFPRRYRMVQHLNRVHKQSDEEMCHIEGRNISLVKVEGSTESGNFDDNSSTCEQE